MELLKEFLRKEVDRMVEQNVRFRTIGCPEKFPEDVREEIKRTKELTRENDRYVLNLALSYGGRDDLVRSFQEIAEGVKQGEYKPEDIDESLVSRHLDTADLPDPDLLIRTSGEKRLSNYLLWQVAYTEIYFSEILWPEFRERKFLDSLFEYQSRDRRFGDRKPVDT